jgi:hypothetical protein
MRFASCKVTRPRFLINTALGVGAMGAAGYSRPARSPEGIFTTFDVPNRSSGQAVGAFWDQSGGHGFAYNSLPD